MDELLNASFQSVRRLVVLVYDASIDNNTHTTIKNIFFQDKILEIIVC